MNWPDFTKVRTLSDMGTNIGQMLAMIRRHYRVETSSPLIYDGGEFRIVPSATLTAQLGTHLGSGRYAFEEVMGASGGTWAVVPGGRTGDDAFEVNGDEGMTGKIVTLRFTEGNDWRFQADHDCECECPIQFCVYVKCDGTALPGATVEIREANASVGTGTIIASGTTDGTGRFCDASIPAGNVDVVVSKTDYHGVTSGPHEAVCNAETTIELQTCRSSVELRVYLGGCSVVSPAAGQCPIEGATVTVTGDATASGTTNGGGLAVINLDVAETCDLELTINAVAPSGSGISFLPVTMTFSPCNGVITLGSAVFVGTPPVDSGLVASGLPVVVSEGCVCGDGHGCATPIPRTLSYTDDYGSCTLEYCSVACLDTSKFPYCSFLGFGGSRWIGAYTYASDAVFKPGTCGSIFTNRYPESDALSIHVELKALGTCGSREWTLTRWARTVNGYTDCPPSLGLGIPAKGALGDSVPGLPGSASAPQCPSPFSRGDESEACDGDATVNFSIDFAAVSGNVGDTDGTAIIAGTCGGVTPIDPITVTVLSNQGNVPIEGASVSLYDGMTLVVTKLADVNGEVVFDEDDGLVEDVEYEVQVSSAPCTQPTPNATFVYGPDPDFTITMNCPEEA